MVEHIHFCTLCGCYTLEDHCLNCHLATLLARPPKFSPADKYAFYRRESRKKELQGQGLY